MSDFRFLHDRIQQAAYSLIPEAHRAEVHVRLGRLLRARLAADELTEELFDVANQFARGAALGEGRRRRPLMRRRVRISPRASRSWMRKIGRAGTS
jgi:predicted ATPase